MLLSGNAFAQIGTIKGFVYDKKNGESIPFASVKIYNTPKGTVTNDNGYFVFSGLAPGDYKLRITCIGYDSLVADITLEANKINAAKKFYLQESSFRLGSVEVSAEKVAAQNETQVSVTRVTSKQILRLPSVGGMPDLAQYLQVLPGVVSTGDQGGQLYMRGGTPIQNKVLIDGMTIYNPFHSIGLFSVFDVDIIKSADVYTAGFNAEYGGRTSSVINVKTRTGNKKRVGGQVDLSTFGGKFLLEGPIVKSKQKDNTLTFLLSLKGSLLSKTSKWFYSYANAEGLPYDYVDGYGKIAFEDNSGNNVQLFGFSFNDRVRYTDIATYKWRSFGGGLSFHLMPKSINMSMDGTIAYSSYKMGLDESLTPERNSRIDGLDFKLHFAYMFGKSVLAYGIEAIGSWTDYKFVSAYGWNIQQKDFNSEFGVFLKYKWTVKRWIIEPGFRLHIFASQSAVSPEPRLAVKYNITDDIRLKLAGGLYAQNLMGVTSDQDVVNLFYGFITVPENVAETFKGKTVKNSLQKAQHIVLGLELDKIPYTTLNIEGYFKNFSRLTNINRYQVFATDKEYIFESGKAYGGDFSAKFEHKFFYVNFVYSLNFVTRDDGVIVYRTHFDRRHNINVMFSYSWGRVKNWSLDLRWNFGTGFPFTKTKGVYPSILYIDDITGEIITVNEELGFALDSLNRGQLPDYHRLDLSIKRKFILAENCSITLGAGVSNVYNYKNIFYVNRATGEKIYQLPLLWNVNVNVAF